MKNTKFIVKVNRGGTDITEYVQRIDRTPIRTTPNPKLLALVMQIHGRRTRSNPSKVPGAPHGF